MRLRPPQLLRCGRFGRTTAAALILAISTSGAVAQSPVPTKTFTNEGAHYSVALPEGCRHDEGPGTLDAVCAPDFDPERSARANSNSALVMQVSTEIVPEDTGRTASELATAYGEKSFREELPQAVCGESDASRVRIENLKQATEENRVVYTADVICAEVSFLQVPERRAAVRFLVGSAARYRLIARGPVEDFDKNKQAIGAFFDSFRVLPPGSKSQ
jgi:hypothetical protein